jgi:hypothetical protein
LCIGEELLQTECLIVYYISQAAKVGHPVAKEAVASLRNLIQVSCRQKYFFNSMLFKELYHEITVVSIPPPLLSIRAPMVFKACLKTVFRSQLAKKIFFTYLFKRVSESGSLSVIAELSMNSELPMFSLQQDTVKGAECVRIHCPSKHKCL